MPAGKVPQVKTKLAPCDYLGTLRARIGFRTDYMVQPGLYRIGEAGPESPVIVTANYKLTFDAVRRELEGQDCWLLIADTDGINVWCAGGKGKFSAEAVADVVRSSDLEKVVTHRTLILPQLAANGVAAHKLRKLCGFSGVFGSILARDLKQFINGGMKADKSMRRVTFDFWERVVLAPVEISLSLKWLAIVCMSGFVLSGIGPDIWTWAAAWTRGIQVATSSVLGLLLGALAVPALLPVLPGRQFAIKGAVAGGAGGLLYIWPMFWSAASIPELMALTLWATAISSFMGMNFTGSTPYTSPTGVEREMRQAIAWQLGGAVLSLGIWLVVPFM